MKKYLFTITMITVMLSSCEFSSVEVQVDCSLEGPSLQVSASDSECGNATGEINLEVTGGLAPFTYLVDNDEVALNAGRIENLGAGVYNVTVIDGNECSATQSVQVESPSGLVITSTSITEAGCESSNGSITITAEGGSGNLLYAIQGETPQSSNSFTGLSTGTFVVEVTDENDCATSQQVEVLSGIKLSQHVSPIISNNCAVNGCHNGTQPPNLSTNSAIISNASRIRARTSAGSMPPSGPLPGADVQAISCWVNDGAPNN